MQRQEGNLGNRWLRCVLSAALASIDQKYLVNLSYIAYYGNDDADATGAATTFAGPFAGLADRGWLSLSFKTTF